jgi:hypothetical protein
MNSKVYDTAFFVALCVTLSCWLAINLVSYEIAWREQKDNPIQFSGGGPIFDWGVPFYWTNAGGYAANVVIVVGTSIIVGHLVRISRERSLGSYDE